MPIGAKAESFELTVDAASNGTSTVVNVTDTSKGGGPARVVKIKDIDWQLGSPIFRATMDGVLRTIQCLGTETLG